MIKPTYPGVYVVEAPSAVHTITAVATSITTFLGRANKGPVNTPERLHTYADFLDKFGPPIPNSQLSMSVQLFFQNGGTDCYVVRLMKNNGTNASVTLKNIGYPASPSQDVLTFLAKEPGNLGNQLVLEVDYDTPSPEDTFHLRIYSMADDGTFSLMEEFLSCSMDWNSAQFTPSFITQSSSLVDCKFVQATLADYQAVVVANTVCYSESRRLIDTSSATWPNDFADLINNNNYLEFIINVDGTRYPIDLTGQINTPINDAGIITAIQHQIDNVSGNALQGKVTVSFKDDTTNNAAVLRFDLVDTSKNSITLEPASTNDASQALMLGTQNGGLEVSRTGFFRPAPNGIFFDISNNNTANNNNLNNIAFKSQDYFNKITFVAPDNIDLGNLLITTVAGHNWYEGKAGSVTNYDGIREKMGIIAQSVNAELPKWNAYVAGYRLVFNKKDPIKNFSGTINTSPHDISSYFKTNTRVYSLGSGSGPYVSTIIKGKDGDVPDADSYKGDPKKHTGFYALDTVDIFNLMVIPYDENLKSNYEDLWAPASTYCQSRRAFLIIEPPSGWKTNDDILSQTTGIRKLRRGVVKDYAAVYYPRLKVPDPNGLKITVNPGGAIAGIMARTDAAIGVWKAPAGLNADIQGGNFDLDYLLTDLENGDLNPEGINCLREFPSGLICWGARTLDGADDFGSQWKYIPIRRLALMIEESLYRGTKWVVFEPNDEPLWAKIRLNVGSFMMQLFRQGAFQGSTPDQAFFVKCDSTTTTQADRDQGIVNIIVGFAPLKPAEFVIITIQQMKGDL